MTDSEGLTKSCVGSGACCRRAPCGYGEVDDAIFEAHNRVRMNAHRSIPAVVCPRCTRGRGTPRGCSYCTGTGEPYAETPALAIDHAILAAMPGLGDYPCHDSITSEQSRQVAGCIECKSSERVREIG